MFHLVKLTLLLSGTGSTWQYLSNGRHGYHAEDNACNFSYREKIRHPFGERERSNNDRDGIKERKSLTETELHDIKTSFVAIESLWRDISMGTDNVSVSVLKSVHQQLGEIGSDLFRRVFLSRGQLLQVKFGI
jgi:hypothetical protein